VKISRKKCRQWSENLNTLKKTDPGRNNQAFGENWGKMAGIGREYDTGRFVRR
jgi:hypothetical protein